MKYVEFTENCIEKYKYLNSLYHLGATSQILF